MSSTTPKQQKVYRVRAYDSAGKCLSTGYYLFAKDVEMFQDKVQYQVKEQKVDVDSSKYVKAVETSEALNADLLSEYNETPRYEYIVRFEKAIKRATRWLNAEFDDSVGVDFDFEEYFREENYTGAGVIYKRVILKLLAKVERRMLNHAKDSPKHKEYEMMQEHFLFQLTRFHIECSAKSPYEYCGFMAIGDAKHIKEVHMARLINCKY